jgi:hypothetical protein
MYDMELGRRSIERNSHGFFHAGVLEERGELPYITMMHVAERRARDLFTVHQSLTRHDRETSAVFADILRDEKYHVAYTGNFVRRWREEGRGREVRRALRAARASSLLGAWKRLGARSGAGLSRLILLALYWTAAAPFGLLARLRGEPPARPRRAARGLDELRSQA